MRSITHTGGSGCGGIGRCWGGIRRRAKSSTWNKRRYRAKEDVHREEIELGGGADEFERAVDFELLIEGVAMFFDGFDGDTEAIGDLFGGQTVSSEGEDLPLAGRDARWGWHLMIVGIKFGCSGA